MSRHRAAEARTGDQTVLEILHPAIANPDPRDNGSYAAANLLRIKQFGDQTKPPVLYKGNFYAEYTTNDRHDGMVCMSMDGQILWQTKRAPDFNKGSIILADEVTSRAGWSGFDGVEFGRTFPPARSAPAQTNVPRARRHAARLSARPEKRLAAASSGRQDRYCSAIEPL